MILVTGAAGTVGSEVVKALAAAGARFRVGYRSRRPALPGAEAVSLDFDRPETIRPALAGVETVFLLSNLVAPELKVVRAAKAAGVRRIVKLSVWRADNEGYSFARWHRPVEREIEGSGWPGPSCGRACSCRTWSTIWRPRSGRTGPSTCRPRAPAWPRSTCATSRPLRSRL